MCQLTYCLHHTRVSPHGPRGGCGLESKCVCYMCFSEMQPQQQAAYERINRLPRTADAAAAAAAAGPSFGGGGGELAAPGLVTGGGEDPLPSGPSTANAPIPAAAVAPAQPPPLDAAAREVARQRWHRSGNVLRAMWRFKMAATDAK